jgi:hypothetical protein
VNLNILNQLNENTLYCNELEDTNMEI